jgi:O-antigen/teichoic acid export membrane protein
MASYRTTANQTILAVFDQAIVSGTSFATAVALGRWAGPEDLALYSLGLALVLFVAAAQDALVLLPFTVFGARLGSAKRARYAGSSLFFCAVLALCATAALGTAAAVVLAGGWSLSLGRLLLLTAVVTPALMIRDFGRRVTAAHLRMGMTLALDGAVAGMQLSGLIWLVARGALTATSGLALVGLASLVGSLVWLAAWRTHIHVRRHLLSGAWRRNWVLGRWIVTSRIAAHLGSDASLLWLLTLMVGAHAAGDFAACLTIAFLANPLVLGIGLFLTPKTATAFAEEGVEGVGRLVTRATLALGVFMTIFVAGVSLSGGSILEMLYGAAYAGLGAEVSVVALAIAVGALSLVPTNALVVVERPAVNLASSVLGLATMAASALFLIPSTGVFGAGLSLLIGNLVQLVARFALFGQFVAAARSGAVSARGELLLERGAV